MPRFVPIFVLILAAAVPGCILAAPGHEHTSAPVVRQTASGVPLAGIDQPAPSLVARYEVRTRHGNGKWSAPIALRFIRTEDRLSSEQPGLSETWRRLKNGEFEFERAFDAERTVVDYASGELRTLGIPTDWDMLRIALDRNTLQGLDAGKPVGSAHGRVVRYRSSGRSGSVVLDWSPELQLPVRLERAQGGQRSELKLLGTATSAQDAAAALDARIADYQRIDSADFGDKESYPFVQKAAQLDVLRGWRKNHEH